MTITSALYHAVGSAKVKSLQFSAVSEKRKERKPGRRGMLLAYI